MKIHIVLHKLANAAESIPEFEKLGVTDINALRAAKFNIITGNFDGDLNILLALSSVQKIEVDAKKGITKESFDI